jgi:hypothetical protein
VSSEEVVEEVLDTLVGIDGIKLNVPFRAVQCS